MPKLLAGLMLLAVVGAWIAGAPAQAQDDLEARVGALETRVAALEAETRENSPTFNTTVADSPSIATPYLGEPLTINGVGSVVTDDFRLPTGRYVVTVEWESGAIVVEMWTNRTEPIGLAFGTPQNAGRMETVFIAGPEVVGGVFLEISNTSTSWRVTFNPR